MAIDSRRKPPTLNRLQQSLAGTDPTTQTGPTQEPDWLQIALDHGKTGNVSQSNDAARKATAQLPDSPIAWHVRGLSSFHLDDNADAEFALGARPFVSIPMKRAAMTISATSTSPTSRQSAHSLSILEPQNWIRATHTTRHPSDVPRLCSATSIKRGTTSSRQPTRSSRMTTVSGKCMPRFFWT